MFLYFIPLNTIPTTHPGFLCVSTSDNLNLFLEWGTPYNAAHLKQKNVRWLPYANIFYKRSYHIGITKYMLKNDDHIKLI